MSEAPQERVRVGTLDGKTEAQLAAIYQELILDHYRRPRNKGALPEADARAERKNPLCGGELVVEVAFDGDVVREARFTGRGCSISQASASMLTEAVRGRTRAEVAVLLARFTEFVHGRAPADGMPADLRALGGVARFPARLKCATLAWSALAEGIAAAPRAAAP